MLELKNLVSFSSSFSKLVRNCKCREYRCGFVLTVGLIGFVLLLYRLPQQDISLFVFVLHASGLVVCLGFVLLGCLCLSRKC